MSSSDDENISSISNKDLFDHPSSQNSLSSRPQVDSPISDDSDQKFRYSNSSPIFPRKNGAKLSSDEIPNSNKENISSIPNKDLFDHPSSQNSLSSRSPVNFPISDDSDQKFRYSNSSPIFPRKSGAKLLSDEIPNSNEKNISSISNKDLFDHPSLQNSLSSRLPVNSPISDDPKFPNFNLFDPNDLNQDDNILNFPYPIPPNLGNDNEFPNDISFQSDNMATPNNNFNISNINPSQNDRDYATQKTEIENENAISIEGKFFLIFILIALETVGITFEFKFKKEKKNQTPNSFLNKKTKRSKKKNKKEIYYKQFKREDLIQIIKESNLLPQELKKEIYKPKINKFIEKLKESPYFFQDLRNFTFKDIFTFEKETEELSRLNDETISDFLEFCQKIGEENLDENLTKIKIFFQIKIGDLIPKQWRKDDCIKYMKAAISQYGTKTLNKLINGSDLPENYKNEINKPNYEYFTGQANIKDNKKFLSKPLIEIFTIGKNNNIPNAIENHENFLNFFKYFKQVGIKGLSNNFQKISDFLKKMLYEDLIKNFYDSEEFKDFKLDIKTQFCEYGYGFLNERKSKANEKPSILKDYGLIKIFK